MKGDPPYYNAGMAGVERILEYADNNECPSEPTSGLPAPLDRSESCGERMGERYDGAEHAERNVGTERCVPAAAASSVTARLGSNHAALSSSFA